MTLPLLILRPLDGALQTEQRAKDLGLTAVVDPLFAVEPIRWLGPEPQDFDALLLTSANALKYGGGQLESYRSLPVLAVGAKTAMAAKSAGFDVAQTGKSGAQDLLRQFKDGQYQNILWLTGEQYTDVSAKQRHVHIIPIYRAKAIALGARAQSCLADQAVILLHSVRAAEHLVSELDRLGLSKNSHHVLAFSRKVAEAAGQGWKSIQTAEHPDDDALLSRASELCQ
ncbi:uroporphyrinogen-III synthase [Parasphingorhabdus sp.]|uniref:uroporphyrinogen-III synthase n=1 Tax=Parasphingorhabdus sp. TaxID=2709688 RepID=UPI003267D604